MGNIITTTKIILSSVAFFMSSMSVSVASEIDFGKQIYPILAESCLRCHGPEYEDKKGRTKKPKQGLRLDTPKHIMAGFVDDDRETRHVLVPGDAAASELYTLTILPEDHDDVMPPSGNPLTKEQTERIKAWINTGAKFGDFKAPVYVNPKSKDAVE